MLTDTIIAIVSTLFLPQVVASFSYYNMFTSKSKLHVFRVKLRNVAKQLITIFIRMSYTRSLSKKPRKSIYSCVLSPNSLTSPTQQSYLTSKRGILRLQLQWTLGIVGLYWIVYILEQQSFSTYGSCCCFLSDGTSSAFLYFFLIVLVALASGSEAF